jgi:hypothetical protein
MRRFKNLLALLFFSAGLAVLGPSVLRATETETELGAGTGDCIKGSYVTNDQCQGCLCSMCKGPPECFR